LLLDMTLAGLSYANLATIRLFSWPKDAIIRPCRSSAVTLSGSCIFFGILYT
jgi:hypothetical protein